MPLIYKPYQATLANKEGQKLYYPRLVKFGKMVNTQKMAELIAEKASLTAGDVHNGIRKLIDRIDALAEVIDADAAQSAKSRRRDPRGLCQPPHGAPRRLGDVYYDCQGKRKRGRVGK